MSWTFKFLNPTRLVHPRSVSVLFMVLCCLFFVRSFSFLSAQWHAHTLHPMHPPACAIGPMLRRPRSSLQQGYGTQTSAARQEPSALTSSRTNGAVLCLPLWHALLCNLFFCIIFHPSSSPLAFLPSWRRAAAMTLRTVLLSLQALMAAAEPDDPQDAVVAKQVCVCV